MTSSEEYMVIVEINNNIRYVHKRTESYKEASESCNIQKARFTQEQMQGTHSRVRVLLMKAERVETIRPEKVK